MAFWRRIRRLPPLGRLLIVLALLLAVFSFDWQPKPPAGLPRVVTEGHAIGELRAGSARENIVPPFPAPIAGLDARPDEPFTGVIDPPAVRALVMEDGGRRMALVSVELVLVPAELRAKVLAAVPELKLDDVILAATHTHSAPGAFWNNRVAGWLGVGAFNPNMEAFLVGQTAKAIRGAAQALRPVRFSSAVVEASNFSSNRTEAKAPVDNRLTVGRFIGADGRAAANIVIYAAHPTIQAPEDDRLSGDWPSALMTFFEADGGPTTLFFQGGGGDVTWAKRRGEMMREERSIRFGREIATEARGAMAAAGEGSATTALDWARVEWALPPADLGGSVLRPFAPFVSNLFSWIARLQSSFVTFLRLDGLRLAFVPGELVSSLDLSWSHEFGATVISLAGDYVGTIESPAMVEEGRGEAVHTFFGPRLAPWTHVALQEAERAALHPPKAQTP